jgi:hypothetical protein
MIEKLIILGQSTIVGILALVLMFTLHAYHTVIEDRDDWIDFITQAYTECEFECNACLDRYAYEYQTIRKKITF